jgi:hypothetical protein
MNARLAEVRAEVEAINSEIERLYEPRIISLNAMLDEVRDEAEALDDQVRQIGEEGIEAINCGIRDIDGRHKAEISQVVERIEEIREAVRGETEAAANPAIDATEWSEPQEDTGAIPPLFDSSRSYMEQIAHYRLHQGKETAPILKRGYRFKLTCVICSKPFESKSKDAATCSGACRQAKFRQFRASLNA